MGRVGRVVMRANEQSPLANNMSKFGANGEFYIRLSTLEPKIIFLRPLLIEN